MWFLAILCFCALANSLEFGLPPKQPRVLGGTFVTIDEAPWHAIIISNSLNSDTTNIKNFLYEVSGAIIRDDMVVTTGSYFSYFPPDRPRKVRAGTNFANAGGQVVEISEILYDERYDGREYDLAIVVLATPLTLSDLINPIPLTNTVYPEHMLGRFTGYGTMGIIGNPDWWFQAADIPLFDHDRCAQIYTTVNINVGETQFCTGIVDAIIPSPCYLDTGGPLTINNELVGLMITHFSCGTIGIPTIFNSVLSSRDWLQDKIDNYNRK